MDYQKFDQAKHLSAEIEQKEQKIAGVKKLLNNAKDKERGLANFVIAQMGYNNSSAWREPLRVALSVDKAVSFLEVVLKEEEGELIKLNKHFNDL